MSRVPASVGLLSLFCSCFTPVPPDYLADAGPGGSLDAGSCVPECSGTTPECVGGTCRCTATSCAAGQSCYYGVCVHGGCDLCSPACFGETPSCNHSSCHCECSATSCSAGRTCDPVSRTCVAIGQCTPACTGTAPDCVSGTCMCNAASCPAGQTCTGGICVSPECGMACTGETPYCDMTLQRCVCTATSCAAGRYCDRSSKACVPSTECQPACSGTTPECVNGVCECTPVSCPGGQTCRNGTCTNVDDCGGPCPQGEACDLSDYTCKCTQNSCPTDQCCSPMLRCVDPADPCAVKVCDPTTPVCVCVNPQGCGCGSVECQCNAISCGPGQVCDATGHCQGGDYSCDPQCTSTQWCDQSQADPVCVEICNPPMGCKASEVCVPDPTGHSGICQPVKCFGAQCDQGQICDDGSFTGLMGCTCLPSYTDSTGTVHNDTCSDYGLACDMDTSSQATIKLSKCRMPREWESCNPAIGCEQPPAPDTGRVDCYRFTDGTAMCMRACTNGKASDTKLCTDPMTSCYAQLQNHCYYNICADPSCTMGDPSCLPSTERSKLFAPCTSISHNDSTCVPYFFTDTTYGLCVQAGTATTECDPKATRSPSLPYATMCGVKSSCIEVMPDPTDPTGITRKGLCTHECNAQPLPGESPVVDCTDTADLKYTCLDMSGAAATETTTRLGLCLEKCGLFGAEVCHDDLLGNKQGCYPKADFSGDGYCTALVGGAGGFGSQCTVSEIDRRSPCADRTFCIERPYQSIGYCYGWCQPSAPGCGDTKLPCDQCISQSCCQTACGGKSCDDADGCGGTCGCRAGLKCNLSTHACEACVPSCAGRTCGDDGCGGTCAPGCPPQSRCDPATFLCSPCKGSCVNRSCGDDGCGQSCGSCAAGYTCRVQSASLACTTIATDPQSGAPLNTPAEICDSP